MHIATRARVVGALGILIALTLMIAINSNLGNRLEEARAKNAPNTPASVWGYITTLEIPSPTPQGQPPSIFLALPLPTMLTIAIICIGLIIAGALLIVRNPERRGIAPYMSTVIGTSFLMLLIWAVAGSKVDLSDTLARVVRLATPLALGALAGVVCERSGVVNIGIEGMMLSGACAGYTAALVFGSLFNTGGVTVVWMGVIFAVFVGALMAALHALLSIRFKVDQIISGTVINIMAVGTTGYIRSNYLIKFAETSPVRSGLQDAPIPLLSQIPLIGPILFNHRPITYLMLILVGLMHILLFRTVWGLRTRAIGEHPKAADTVGIKVNQMRFRNVMIGGMLAGLAGGWFALESTFRFDDAMTNGAGFIALAAMIFGKWTPLGAFGGALLFASANALQLKVQAFDFALPRQFLQMLPYIVTIVVLAGVIGRARPPAAIGQPYDH